MFLNIVKIVGAMGLFFFLNGCGTSPEKTIVKRWKTVGKIENGKEIYVPEKQTNGKDNVGFEFARDGKLIVYSKDGIEMTGLYTIASDGKSLLISDAMGRETQTVKILSLSRNKLIIAIKAADYEGPGTIILTPN